jgi:hypothetical protein
MYDLDKIVYIGGGIPPSNKVEIIDCSGNVPLKWNPTGDMQFSRRQHNGTLLPDGTVLVTGGTRGTGPPGSPEAFNDLKPRNPVHEAELWNPATNAWTVLATESEDRCYHSTAVPLTDATVLSAGGGEFPSDDKKQANPPRTLISMVRFSVHHICFGDLAQR